MHKKMNFFHAAMVTFTLTWTVATGAWASGFQDMYVIGDSLSDQGNIFAATEFLGGSGAPADDHYFMGRFANGEIYAGVLAEKLGVALAPSLPPLGDGHNFANGGARTDYNIVELDATKPFPVPLLMQDGQFPKDDLNDPFWAWTLIGQRQAFVARQVNDPDALYIVFAGANDMADLTAMAAFGLLDQAGQQAVIVKVIQGIDDAIQAFVDAGAQHIVVPNLPNLGVVPAITNVPGLSGLAMLLSTQYNMAFDAMLEKWNGVVNIIPFDTFSLITAVAFDPQAFGFSNATEPCYTGFVDPAGPNDTVCSDPDGYVFWDRVHPTSSFHAFLADRMLTVIVLDILDHLIQKVDDLDVENDIKQSLNDKLASAKHVLTDENTNNDLTALQKLSNFVSFVEKKQGKQIPNDDALVLIDGAEKIIPLLNANH